MLSRDRRLPDWLRFRLWADAGSKGAALRTAQPGAAGALAGPLPGGAQPDGRAPRGVVTTIDDLTPASTDQCSP